MDEPIRKIGPYKLIRKIGRGAFGVVWLAERQSAIAAMQVALKLPRDEDIDLEAFKQEAVIWVQASGHPNVVSLIDADIYDGQIVIVSEFVPDGSLAMWLRQQGGKAPSIESACQLIDGVLAGLAHLHERGIIHRDLKPDNILLQRDTPRLADFGIARLLRSGSYSSHVSGTWAYMSPEAFDGKRNERTDIWAVGVIFYQLLSGRLPYNQQDTMALVGAIMRNDPPPLPESLPEPLRNIVTTALQRDATQRYSSASSMRKDTREAERLMWLKAHEEREVTPTLIRNTVAQTPTDQSSEIKIPARFIEVPPTVAAKTTPQPELREERRQEPGKPKQQSTLKVDPILNQPQQFRPPPPETPFNITPAQPDVEMSTLSTLTSIFFEPGRTFEALRTRPRFLIATLLMLLLTIVVTATLYQRVDMSEYIRAQIEKSPQSANQTPEQKEAGVKIGKIVGEITIPATVPITVLVGAMLYFFGVKLFGGSIGYKKSLAVWSYSSLPISVLGTIIALLVLFLRSPETINPERLLITNLAAFLEANSSRVLTAFLSQLDLLKFYGLFLAAVGLRKVARLSSGSAWGVVIVWYLIGSVLKIAGAAIFGG